MSMDVIAFGETMLRLTPPGFERFSQATNFEIHIGGSESNTAVGLSRLGLRVAWLSRLTDNPLGRKIAEGLAAHGVDTRRIIWTSADRVGTYYLERGTRPRGSQVFYDRAGSAMSRIEPRDFPTSVWLEERPRVFHTTGITLGISPSAAATAEAAARQAKEAGVLISFDVNYRSKLWSPEAAQRGCETLLGIADIVFIPERDLATIYGCPTNDISAAIDSFARRCPQATVVVTRGGQGAAARTASGVVHLQPALMAEEVERLGGGDAFSAGYLYGLLTSADVAQALRWGVAVAALKYTIPSDLPLIDHREVRALVEGESRAGVNR
jgi:2-dehydro-3-deoxygluconokinase